MWRRVSAWRIRGGLRGRGWGRPAGKRLRFAVAAGLTARGGFDKLRMTNERGSEGGKEGLFRLAVLEIKVDQREHVRHIDGVVEVVGCREGLGLVKPVQNDVHLTQ